MVTQFIAETLQGDTEIPFKRLEHVTLLNFSTGVGDENKLYVQMHNFTKEIQKKFKNDPHKMLKYFGDYLESRFSKKSINGLLLHYTDVIWIVL